MNEGRTVFAQLLDFLPKYEFDKCVVRYHGDFRVRKLPTYEQFLVLAFAQLTWRESLRDEAKAIAGLLEEKASIPMVQQQLPLIQELQTDEWWQNVTSPMLENVRKRIRALVKLIEKQKAKTDFHRL
jgi:type I site-specific restriction endonuclease